MNTSFETSFNKFIIMFSEIKLVEDDENTEPDHDGKKLQIVD